MGEAAVKVCSISQFASSQPGGQWCEANSPFDPVERAVEKKKNGNSLNKHTQLYY